MKSTLSRLGVLALLLQLWVFASSAITSANSEAPVSVCDIKASYAGKEYKALFDRLVSALSMNTIGAHPKASIRRALLVLIAGGHVRFVDDPGTGKTRLVKDMGIGLGLTTTRAQFTPDVTPKMLTKREVLMEIPDGMGGTKKEFVVIDGPITSKTQLFHGDELSRAPTRTQSGLLEAMAERQSTYFTGEGKVVTETLDLAFRVFATDNPHTAESAIEGDGTNPIPEAQQDRFMAELSLGTLEGDELIELLNFKQSITSGLKVSEVPQILDDGTFVHLVDKAKSIAWSNEASRHTAKLMAAARESRYITRPTGQRAPQDVQSLAKVIALSEGRTEVVDSDIDEAFIITIPHRVDLTSQYSHAANRIMPGKLRNEVIREVVAVIVGQANDVMIPNEIVDSIVDGNLKKVAEKTDEAVKKTEISRAKRILRWINPIHYWGLVSKKGQK